jgi:hypothetical protein
MSEATTPSEDGINKPRSSFPDLASQLGVPRETTGDTYDPATHYYDRNTGIEVPIVGGAKEDDDKDDVPTAEIGGTSKRHDQALTQESLRPEQEGEEESTAVISEVPVEEPQPTADTVPFGSMNRIVIPGDPDTEVGRIDDAQIPSKPMVEPSPTHQAPATPAEPTQPFQEVDSSWKSDLGGRLTEARNSLPDYARAQFDQGAELLIALRKDLALRQHELDRRIPDFASLQAEINGRAAQLWHQDHPGEDLPFEEASRYAELARNQIYIEQDRVTAGIELVDAVLELEMVPSLERIKDRWDSLVEDRAQAILQNQEPNASELLENAIDQEDLDEDTLKDVPPGYRRAIQGALTLIGVGKDRILKNDRAMFILGGIGGTLVGAASARLNLRSETVQSAAFAMGAGAELIKLGIMARLNRGRVARTEADDSDEEKIAKGALFKGFAVGGLIGAASGFENSVISGVVQEAPQIQEHLLTGIQHNVSEAVHNFEHPAPSSTHPNPVPTPHANEGPKHVEPEHPPKVEPLQPTLEHTTFHITHDGDNLDSSIQRYLHTDEGRRAFGIDHPTWINPENGITQEQVLAAVIEDYGQQNGYDVEQVENGEVLSLTDQVGGVDVHSLHLTPEQIENLRRVSQTTNIAQFLSLQPLLGLRGIR